ncbi:hypothetical protein ABZV67_19295 [Streptomyces sp. NPDC005065]|uniref:hypothetical protein n=1 Tax=Streptomyces sp. NPDC005065 TaxID=3154461 RepID=UPI0033AE0C01
MSYDMSYYGSDGGYESGEYEPDQYEEPQQRQQNAPRSPGLRAHVKQLTSDNKALKQQVQDQAAALAELMGDDSPQQAASQPPTSRLTQAEQMQYSRLQEMGVMGAPPMGSDAEQARRVRSCKSPEELAEYLVSQGNTLGTMSYQGMGY